MPPYRTSATILVVDDEPLIRTYVRNTIEEFGFTALEAGGADAQIAQLRVAFSRRPYRHRDSRLH
jgi:CheY-like chemotaxis protein